MADPVETEITLDGGLDSAAAAIAGLLNAQPPSQDINGNDVAQAVDPELNSTQANPATDPASVEPDAKAAEAAAPELQPSASVPQPVKIAPTSDAETAKIRQEAETARNQYLNALNVHLPQLEAAIRGEFNDIKTQQDLIDLADPRSAKYNPERYNSFQAATMRLNAAQQDRNKAVQEMQEQENSRLSAWRNEQQTKVAELIPELKDAAKGPALAQKLWAYAQEAGYGREQMERASATDVHLLYQAMLYRDGNKDAESKLAQAAKDLEAAKAKAAKAPPVQQPGTRSNSASKDEKIQSDFERLTKTGRTDDAAAVFRNIFN